MNADRDLLFGLLALQLNFVDRNQLVAAFDRWSTNKTLSLGQIFHDQGVLAADEHALLDALVAKHLKRHAGDAEKSLADLTPIDSARDDLKRLADADLEVSLAHVSAPRHDDCIHPTLSYTAGGPRSSRTRFRILRPHARGGLGEVFVAHDEELHRDVALKEILVGHADDPNARGRFLLEAEITGGLEHPGIVPVYGLGTYADGRPFYAMRFIQGDSLSQAIKRFHRPDQSTGERELELRQLLGRFIDVCNAIDYAHSRGVLHRDLKPGNIMLGKYGETLVVDWGLAKVVGGGEAHRRTDESTLRPTASSGSAPTAMGHAVGTPEFMSPEQANGRLDELGPASDVYSLGATLYMLLTGRAPVVKDDAREIVAQVAIGDFPRPREVKHDVPRALEAICVHAMALRPSGRYVSPRALSDDVEHWLADEPIVAMPDTAFERAARWTRRHRALARSAAAALLIISVVSVTAALVVEQARRGESLARESADRAADRERQEARRAEGEKRNAQFAEGNARQAAEREKTHRIEAERHARIATTLRLATQSQLVRAERPVPSTLLALEAIRLADARETASFTAARQALYDGLANLGGTPLSGYAPFWLSSDAVSSLRFSADGRWLATNSDKFSPRLWDLRAAGKGPRSVALRGRHGGGDFLEISADSRWLAAVIYGTIKLWSLSGQEPVADPIVLPVPGGRVTSLSFSPDGHWLACTSFGKGARLWNLTAPEPLAASIVVNENALRDDGKGTNRFHAFSPDSRWFVTTSVDGVATLWNLRAHDPQASAVALRGPKMTVVGFDFSPDGHWLVTRGDDESAWLWDLAAKDPSANALALVGHREKIDRLEFSHDGHWMVSGAEDGTMLWELRSSDRLLNARRLDKKPVRGDPNDRWFLAFGPDGRWLATSWQPSAGADDHGTARLWNLAADEPAENPISLNSPSFGPWSWRFSPDGRWLTETSGARLWDMKGANPAASGVVLRGQKRPTASAFSRDARWLTTAGDDGDTRLWDLASEPPATASHLLRGHEGSIDHVTFSPDGQWLATEGSINKEVRLWNLTQGSFVADSTVLVGQSYPHLSPNGRWLSTIADDSSIHLHDLAAPDPTASTMVLRGARSQAFSPDGRWWATSDEGAVRLWDLSANAAPARQMALQGHAYLVFSGNGRWLAAILNDSPIHLWDLNPAEPAAAITIGPKMKRAPTWPSLIVSADGRWLADQAEKREILLWTRAAEDKTAGPITLNSQKYAMWFQEFSRDERWFAVQSGGPYAGLWDLRAKDPAASFMELKWNKSETWSVALSPDGHWLAARTFDRDNEPGGSVRLCNLKAEDPIADSLVLEGHLGFGIGLEFSPDGRWLTGHSSGATIGLWKMATKDRPVKFMQLHGQQPTIHKMAFSLDGRWLAILGDDSAQFWDLTAHEPMASSVVLRGHFDSSSPLLFAADGQWLAIAVERSKPDLADDSPADEDRGEIHLWPLKQEELIRRAMAAAGRELTLEEREQFLIPTAAAFIQRGVKFMDSSEWRQAQAHFTRAAELDAAKADLPLYLRGVAQLAAGDAAGYRQTWLELYERFKTAEDDEVLERIVLAFVAGNPEPKLSAEVVRLAQRYAKHDVARKRLVGGALVRDGQFAAAVEAFKEASRHAPPRDWDLLLTAMAHHQLGKAFEALMAYSASLRLGDEPDGSWERWSEEIEVEALDAEVNRLLPNEYDQPAP